MRDSQALSLVYTPGVAEPAWNRPQPKRSFDVTCRGNTAIVSNGSSAFGMGNIGGGIYPCWRARP